MKASHCWRSSCREIANRHATTCTLCRPLCETDETVGPEDQSSLKTPKMLCPEF